MRHETRRVRALSLPSSRPSGVTSSQSPPESNIYNDAKSRPSDVLQNLSTPSSAEETTRRASGLQAISFISAEPGTEKVTSLWPVFASHIAPSPTEATASRGPSGANASARPVPGRFHVRSAFHEAVGQIVKVRPRLKLASHRESPLNAGGCGP